MNGRLISFYHNHLYREKKTRGSQSLNVTMLDMYNAGEIALMDASATVSSIAVKTCTSTYFGNRSGH